MVCPVSLRASSLSGEIIMYAKGADDVIFDRMSSTYDVPAFEETRYHINEYSSIGTSPSSLDRSS